MSDSTTIDWIDAPLADAGVFVADDVDGWHYRSYTELAEVSAGSAGAARERYEDNACIVMPPGHRCVAAMYAVWLRSHGNADRTWTFGSDATYVRRSARYCGAPTT
jgi:hypothetical protein